jgi:hypothetical protein
MPPRPILQEKNWLLSLVSKGSFETASIAYVNCVNAYELFGVLGMVLQGLN